MKKYDNYKNSGIEWIGKIPENWEMWKISHSFLRIGSGTTPESGNPIYHENGTINWLNTGDLNDGILESCAKKVTNKALEDYSSLKIFPAGSLVMAMYGATIGKTCIINFATTTNQACCVFCKGDIIDVKFLQYWFIGNKEHIINLAIGGGQPNISQNILKDVRVSCPNFEEQTQIANFLDHKTTQIDTLISKKEQFISLLQEERIAVINQAVTKGLDPKVKMKDSGIEWLGEIPEHWEVKKLKYCLKIQSGKGITNEELKPDGGFAVYGGNGIMGYTDKYTSEGIDLIIGRVGALCGNVHLIFGKKWISDNALFARTDENEYFMEYFLRFLDLNRLANKNAQPLITGAMVKEQFICLPIIEEQLNIVNYVRNQHLRIDTLLSKTQQEIELLKEYKTALISEVVTGKVDVRNIKLN